jgi:hypothetical protein
MTLWDSIHKLYTDAQKIKRKCPIVVSYLKTIEKLKDDDRDNEIECFKQFLLKNPSIIEKQFDDGYYKGIKIPYPINFQCVVNLLQPDDLNLFWENILNIDHQLFPNGRPAVDETVKQAVNGFNLPASTASIIQANPMYSEIFDQIKSTVANNNDTVNVMDVMQSKEFKKVAKSIKNGISSGKYNVPDLTKSLASLVKSVEDNLDDDNKNMVNSVLNMVDAMQRGEQPDVSKLYDIISKLNM